MKNTGNSKDKLRRGLSTNFLNLNDQTYSVSPSSNEDLKLRPATIFSYSLHINIHCSPLTKGGYVFSSRLNIAFTVSSNYGEDNH